MKLLPADSLRAVLQKVFEDPAYHWVTPRDPLAPFKRWLDRLAQWFDQLSTAHPTIGYFLIAILTIVLVVILVHGAWVVAATIRRASEKDASPGLVRIVEKRDAAWHRRESARLSREGRFAEALMEEFWALIGDLESRELVRFHPSKTPGEYLLEPRLGAADRTLLCSLVDQLYTLVFAGRGCRAEDVLAWRTMAMKEWGVGAH